VSINTGSGDMQLTDFASGFLGNANEHILKACETLKAHPDLQQATGINLVGFSQGGQFARALVQRCR
jgi:palmitoyl-protein thioesterase